MFFLGAFLLDCSGEVSHGSQGDALRHFVTLVVRGSVEAVGKLEKYGFFAEKTDFIS